MANADELLHTRDVDFMMFFLWISKKFEMTVGLVSLVLNFNATIIAQRVRVS
jgi:hypothetical protein